MHAGERHSSPVLSRRVYLPDSICKSADENNGEMETSVPVSLNLFCSFLSYRVMLDSGSQVARIFLTS